MGLPPSDNQMDDHRASSRQEGKKVTRAFKITKALDEAVISQAEKQGITPSSFINRLLLQYFDWWHYASKGSTFLTLDRLVLTALIEDLDEEKTSDIARSIALITARDFLKFRFGKLDSETVFNFLGALDLYMHWGDVKTIKREDGGLEVLVKHDMGIKWSIFISEFVSSLLSSFLDMQTSVEFSTFGCDVLAVPAGVKHR
jgi:hypothetical protein